MKRLFILVFLFIAATVAPVVSGRVLTLEQIFKSDLLHLKHLNNPKWLPNSSAFVFIKQDTSGLRSLFTHQVADGKEDQWINGAEVVNPGNGKMLIFSDYRIAPSGNKIVFKTDAKRVWRRYDDARYFVYDIQTKQMHTVYDGPERIRHAKLSPDETKIGYVLKNNIYIKK